LIKNRSEEFQTN